MIDFAFLFQICLFTLVMMDTISIKLGNQEENDSKIFWKEINKKSNECSSCDDYYVI